VKRYTFICLSIILVVLVVSCQSTNQFHSIWKNSKAPDNDEQTILLASISNADLNREIVEDRFYQVFKKKRLPVLKGTDVLPSAFAEGTMNEKIDFKNAVELSGATVIILITLLEENSETRGEGITSYQPTRRFGYYKNAWAYYNAWYPALYSPGYYVEDRSYFFETNAYDQKTEELLWSGQSKQIALNDLESFIDDYAINIYNRLRKDRIIKK
jgi:hypothetical protein